MAQILERRQYLTKLNDAAEQSHRRHLVQHGRWRLWLRRMKWTSTDER